MKTFTIKELVEARKVQASDGPNASDLRPGASHPMNWVTQLQTGLNADELKTLAHSLHAFVAGWQTQALEANDAFKKLNMNGGKNFEMFSPILLKGMSREKLMMLAEICTKFMQQAPTI